MKTEEMQVFKSTSLSSFQSG